MSGFVAYAFTDAQKVDIRRFCGYPMYGSGDVVFPYPWILRIYLALEWRLDNTAQSEGTVIVSVYLANLYTLESAIPGAGSNLATDEASVWKHNRKEVRDREYLFDSWRRRLCQFIGVPPGPEFVAAGNHVALIA